MKYRIYKLFILLLLSITLAGCGFHLRNDKMIYPQLRTLYLDSMQPYSPFTTALRETLKSLHIQLTKHPAQAPLTLRIVSNTFKHNNPAITSTNMAVTYTFTLTTVIEIVDKGDHIVAAPIHLSSSLPVTLNSAQVLNMSIGDSARQQMIRNNVQKIYFWLVSTKTRKKLEQWST